MTLLLAAALLLANVISASIFASGFIPSSEFASSCNLQLSDTDSSIDSMSIPKINLLSSLVNAARHGSETIIRLCNEARSGNVQFKEEGEARSAMTIADTAAQKVIVSSLLSKYLNLNIVGEEDEPMEIDVGSKKELNDTMLDSVEFYLPVVLKESDDLEEPPDALNMDEITIYVDPLDGTREFVEGRLSNVQCLVGLCWHGRPLTGAIGLPFGSDKDETSTEVVFGLVGKGIGKLFCSKADTMVYEACSVPESNAYFEGSTIHVLSGDSSSDLPAIAVAERVFEKEGIQRHIAGGCGNKLLRQTQGITLVLQHIKTCLWDTTVPSSGLTAVGGKVTDYFGFLLLYGTNDVLGNQLGVVSSGPGASKQHDELTKANRGEKRLRSVLSKFVLCCDDDSEQCVDIVWDLDGHPLPVTYFAEHVNIQADTYSCPESCAVRGIMSNACRVHLQPTKQTVFYKQVEFSHLEHAWTKLQTAPHKLTRDVNSYEVETSFLASKACEAIIKKTAEAAKELETGVWKLGSYVQPKLQTLNQCDHLAAGWEKNKINCRILLVQDYNQLPRIVECWLTHLLKSAQLKMLHLQSKECLRMVIRTVHADRLVDGGEASLLKHYYDELQLHLFEYDTFKSIDDVIKHFDYATFIEQYETGVLDLCRLVLAHAWIRFEPIEDSDQEGRERTMNKNSYNKCVNNVVWLMSRCNNILESRSV